ncbi:alpha-tocopherol transfer protein-like [Homalodisca vitripennis]|uniref:alpha-tocopherol transfer protein-like n=1 Tax=Homalodisca vitripennis TaxID=197043 RepID=UPI001EEA52FB|nr:alpha-tocopherol transfer protein-like [Homalodisca vitripennis]
MKVRTLWPEDVAKVRQCLGLTDDALASDVTALKDWLRKQPHLGPLVGVDEDKWLQNYLILNKNSVERAKANLDSYFSIRWIMPEVFQQRDMADREMELAFDNTCIAFMPGLTAEGHRVVVYSHFTDDSTHFQPQHLAKRLFAIADICLAEGVDRVSDIVILDLQNTRASHLAKYNLAFVKNLFDHGWKAYPERVAAIHIINPPSVMEMTLNLFKPFLKQKMRNRIQIHNKLESLKDHIPLESIPSDYGGLGPSCRDMNRAWQAKMVERRELLDTVANHKSREHLRPDSRKHVTSWTDLGVEGTFRKLSLD